MMIDLQIPSPIMLLPLEVEGVNVYIKREDLIHPEYGGNKYRKLKYNLDAFRNGGYSHIVTFGGAFSNHIAATAAMCKDHGIKSIGLIRGDRLDSSNPTLKKASDNGMKLIPISRSEYRLKHQSPVVQKILSELSHPYIVPEGGSNAMALLGVTEMMNEINDHECHFDELVVSGGTGATAAAIIKFMKEGSRLTIVNALKNRGLDEELVRKFGIENTSRFTIDHEAHHGGYAKVTAELIEFINTFKEKTKVPLDPIYTGKMMYAVIKDYVHREEMMGKNILCIHTGGLQGVEGFNYLQNRMNKDQALMLR